MKTKSKVLDGLAVSLALVVLWTVLLSTLGSSCRSANQASYRAVGAERVTVQTAMGAWNQYVGLFHPGTNAELKVKGAYEKWRAAQMLVCDAGAVLAAYNQTNAAGSFGASSALEQAIADEEQDKGDLFGLLSALGVKLP